MGIGAVVIVCALGFSVYWLSGIKSLTISSIEVIGADAALAESVRSVAQDSLQGSTLVIFPRANILWYPRRSIEDAIREQHPEIASSEMELVDGNKLSIQVVEWEPSALVCASYPDFHDGSLELNDPGTCYFIDRSGRIFKEAPSFSARVYHIYYIPDLMTGTSSARQVVGSQAVSSDEFAALEDFYTSVESSGIIVDALFVKEDGEYELYVHGVSPRDAHDGGHTVVIHFGGPSLEQQLSNLVSFWDHMKLDPSPPVLTDIKLNYPPNVYYTESQ